MVRSIDEVDHELMEEMAAIAAQGRKALESHPDSPYSSWARNQSRLEERMPETEIDAKNSRYGDLVGFEGPKGQRNPFGVLNYRLDQTVTNSCDKLTEAIWHLFSAGEGRNHPGLLNGYSSPDDVKIDASELSAFVDQALGYSSGSAGVSEGSMTKMTHRANRLEDYFDRMTAHL